jgi:hypothetical protein
MDKFRQDATAAVTRYQKQAAIDGTRLVDAPMGRAWPRCRWDRSRPTRSRSSQGYTADLITGLSKKAAADVNGVIARAFLGGQSIDGHHRADRQRDERRKVRRPVRNDRRACEDDRDKRDPARELDGGSGTVRRSRAASSGFAEAVVPHSGRASSSSAAHLGDWSGGECRPAVQRSWRGLMFPRDPNGSAWNTINCHCLMRPYFSTDALTATAKDKGLLDSLGISISSVAA